MIRYVDANAAQNADLQRWRSAPVSGPDAGEVLRPVRPAHPLRSPVPSIPMSDLDGMRRVRLQPVCAISTVMR